MAEQELPETSIHNEEKFLATALSRFEADVADEKELRDDFKIDLAFEAGDQWDERVKAERIKEKRPALTFNRCHTFVQQVANEARQQKPSITYIPQEENDKELAQIYEDAVRHIQYSSEARIAYETALEYAAAGGFGYYRMVVDYCDEESDDLEPKILTVPDPLAVYGVLVPFAFQMEPDHAFIVTDVPREQFADEHPDSKILSGGFDEEAATGWAGTETIRKAEYWYMEKTRKERISNLSTQRRISYSKKIKFCHMTAAEVIKGTEAEWPGSIVPIFPVTGKARIIEGKPRLYSVIRFQRGAQELINGYKTRTAETLMTAPIQPFMVARGQITNQTRAQWETLNTKLRPYLEYEPTDAKGNAVGEPKRQVFEPPILALSRAAAEEIEDMKATAGIYDASLGARSNETSGRAIERRQQQSNVTNLHFLDNLERSFTDSGRELGRVWPKVISGPRLIRLLGKDEVPKMARVNQQFRDPRTGKPKSYAISDAVKFDLVVGMERSFSTRRTETFEMMTEFARANPESFPMWADIFWKNSDAAGADQLAERFKKMLPPALQDDEEAEPIPPAAKAQIAQMSAMVEALTQQVKELTGTIQTKQMELDSKEKIAAMQAEVDKLKIQADLLKAHEQMASSENMALFQADIQRQFQELQARIDQVARTEEEESAMRLAEQGGGIAMEQAEQQGIIQQRQAEQQARLNPLASPGVEAG